jgi:hypothetical protein
VAQLVGGDVSDAGGDGLVVEDLAEPVAGERSVALDQEPVRAHPDRPLVGHPVVENCSTM